jgi:geranylgeranyl reductase family protein
MKTKIAIVGAGPAGSTAAKHLAEHNIHVEVFDKDTFPRNKPCGGGIPIWTFERFPYLKKISSIECYSYGGKIHSPMMEYSVDVVKETPALAMVLRKQFDHELLKLAEQAGARVHENTRIKDIEITDKQIHLQTTKSKSLPFDLVIGADGFNSVIGKKTDLSKPQETICVCIVEEFPINPTIITKYFSKKRLCHINLKFKKLTGYGWIFPKQNHINIGLGEYRIKDNKKYQKRNLKQVFQDYLNTLKEHQILPESIESTHPLGGSIPLEPLNQTFTDRIILCGDAAGFVNPISGEGIFYAMASGLHASQTILEAIKMKDFSEKTLSTYHQKWYQDFGRDISIMHKATKYWKRDSDRLLRALSKDEKLAEMCYELLTGQRQIYNNRLKFLLRLLYASLKIGD